VRARKHAIAIFCGLSAAAIPVLAWAFTPQKWSPTVEAQNFSKVEERQTIYNTPGYQVALRTVSAENTAAALAEQVNDPGREFVDHLCTRGDDGCAGDARLYAWETNGYGVVQPVYYTARSGATISGHVWATRGGPARRPGVVITNGSVQADEQLYWFAAQTLAKAGYVVLTFDPQGQGQSDTPGEGADQQEGVPAQSDGRPFFDGTEDAINFFLSTPASTYVPVPSCSSGTSHAAKQNARVAQGLDNAYNPFWSVLDAGRIGLAGHSYGAAGVSYIGQWDPRVKALVAWDNLAQPDPNAPTRASGGGPEEKPCLDPKARSIPPITKPALGMSADYFLPPEPNTSQPDPSVKTAESVVYSNSGVDTGELIIRGGSHLDFSFIPNVAFGASLRGADMISWYTTAWLDKYVKGDPTADARLLTTRWRGDAAETAIDVNHDGNMFSFFYQSRLRFHRAPGSGGALLDCEDMRAGCAGLTSHDGAPGDYSYVAIDTTADSGCAPANAPSGTGIYPWTAQIPASRPSATAGSPNHPGCAAVKSEGASAVEGVSVGQLPNTSAASSPGSLGSKTLFAVVVAALMVLLFAPQISRRLTGIDP
jgi:dienelactone hydrolase